MMIDRLKSAMVGLGATWVLWLMLVLSVISLAVMLERAWFFWSVRDDVEKLMRELSRLLRGGDMEAAKRTLEQSPSAEAAVVMAGLVESDMGVEAAEEAMAGAQDLQRLRLERRLAFLGTLGNNAPFIGLLGTVIGIVQAFDELGKVNVAPGTAAAASQMAPTAVMTAISEALVATAVGLVVAIPAVAAFNAFQRMVKVTVANTDALCHVLLAYLKGREGGGAHAAKADGPRTSKTGRPEEPSTEGAN